MDTVWYRLFFWGSKGARGREKIGGSTLESLDPDA